MVTDVCVIYFEWRQPSLCFTVSGDSRLYAILSGDRRLCYTVSGDRRLYVILSGDRRLCVRL